MTNTISLLSPGDVFVVRGKGAVSAAIAAIERYSSCDFKAVYTHAGIIQTEHGLTLEAMNRGITEGLLWQYEGRQVCIARWVGIPEEGIPGVTRPFFRCALDRIKAAHLGQAYPWWRLALHILPGLARVVSAGGRYVVCSELVAKYLWQLAVVLPRFAIAPGAAAPVGYADWPRHNHYVGATPDHLADEWHRWRGYEIIYEGPLVRADFM